MRKLLLAVSILLLAWAAAVVPLPFAALEPVPAMAVADIIEFEDGLDDEIPDELRFTAIRLRQPTAVGTVQVLFDEHRELTVGQAIVPPGIDPDEFAEFQERLFRESVQAAVATGLDAAGRDVTVAGDGARVLETIPGGPADGVLQQEDVITAVDDQPVSLASELASVLSEGSVDDSLTLTFRREGQEMTETLGIAPIGQASAPGQVGIGVLVATVDLQIDMPVEVRPTAETRIGGPSAGLMIALGAYSAASGDVIADGRIVAGSGTMDLTGKVGRVDGIVAKVRGAVLADAEIFLVPESLAEQARAVAPQDLEVIGVTTLQEGIDALSDR